jgi:hypothetical protein
MVRGDRVYSALDGRALPHTAAGRPDAGRHLTLEGLFRRRTRHAADLLHVFPGNLSLVCRFRHGGAVVPTWGEDEWGDLCQRIKRINPEARFNVPGMFGLPGESGRMPMASRGHVATWP